MVAAEDSSLGETGRSISFLSSIAASAFGDSVFVDFVPLQSQSWPVASFISVLAGPLTNARLRQTLLENVEWMQLGEYARRLFRVHLLLFLKAGQKWKKGSIRSGATCPPAPWLLLSNERGGWWIFSGKIVEDIWPSFLSDAAEMSL